MGVIELSDPVVESPGTVRVDVSASGELSKYVSAGEFVVTYGFDVSDVPESLLTVPALTTMAPLAWITGSDVDCGPLDRDLRDSLQAVKHGYDRLYPGHFDADTEIRSDEIVETSATGDDYGMLFTGGVDSTATYLRHRDRSPRLISVKNSRYYDGEWQRRTEYIETLAAAEGLEYSIVRSNVGSVLDHRILGLEFRSAIDRSWWGGVQYGIAYMGLCAPICHRHGVDHLLQGSGYTQDPTYPEAQPFIVDPLSFGGVTCELDAVEETRQEKIDHIASHVDDLDVLTLHSCSSHRADGNCCACAKCYRTLLGVAAAGVDPAAVGFEVDEGILTAIRSELERGEIEFKPVHVVMWSEIQDRVDDERFFYSGCRDFVEWFADYDLERNRVADSGGLSVKQRIYDNLPYPLDYHLLRVNDRLRS